MELKYGWICPKCGKALSPDTKAYNCYKEEKKEDKIINDIKPLGPLEVETPFSKPFKWVKDWPTPYDDQPKFKFYTSGQAIHVKCAQIKESPFAIVLSVDQK